jgi:hypothetical protein
VRRALQIIGAFALTIVVAAGIGIGVLIYQGRGLDAESRAFVDAAVPAIAAGWSKDQLLERATPELRANAKPSELRALFDALARLGPLIEYQGATGEARMSYMIGSGSTVSASYIAKARFQNGTATFRIVALRRDGHWMIHNFHADAAGNDRAEKRT